MNNKIIFGVLGAAVLGALYFMTSTRRRLLADKSMKRPRSALSI